MTEPSHLPNDLAACQALLAERSRELAERSQELAAQRLTITTHELTIASLSDRLTEHQQKITALEHKTAEQEVTINNLLRRAFEKRSERYLESPDQLRLDFRGTPAEDAAAEAAESLAEAIAQAAASEANRIVVPEHTRLKRVPRKPRCEQLPDHWNVMKSSCRCRTPRGVVRVTGPRS